MPTISSINGKPLSLPVSSTSTSTSISTDNRSPRAKKQQLTQQKQQHSTINNNIIDIDVAVVSKLQEEAEFLYELLKKARYERDVLLKQIEGLTHVNEDKDIQTEQLVLKLDLERQTFKKVLERERRKFDDKLLNIQNISSHREALLVEWSIFATQMGIKYPQMLTLKPLLTKTCRSSTKAKTAALKVYRSHMEVTTSALGETDTDINNDDINLNETENNNFSVSFSFLDLIKTSEATIKSSTKKSKKKSKKIKFQEKSNSSGNQQSEHETAGEGEGEGGFEEYSSITHFESNEVFDISENPYAVESLDDEEAAATFFDDVFMREVGGYNNLDEDGMHTGNGALVDMEMYTARAGSSINAQDMLYPPLVSEEYSTGIPYSLSNAYCTRRVQVQEGEYEEEEVTGDDDAGIEIPAGLTKHGNYSCNSINASNIKNSTDELANQALSNFIDELLDSSSSSPSPNEAITIITSTAPDPDPSPDPDPGSSVSNRGQAYWWDSLIKKIHEEKSNSNST